MKIKFEIIKNAIIQLEKDLKSLYGDSDSVEATWEDWKIDIECFTKTEYEWHIKEQENTDEKDELTLEQKRRIEKVFYTK